MRYVTMMCAAWLVLIAAARAEAQTSTAPATTRPAATAPASDAAAKKAADPVEDFIQKTKKPVNWLEWGFDHRAREEYQGNNRTLDKNAANHESHFQRYRSRLWTKITPVTDVDINTRLTWEFRNFCKPDTLNSTDMDEALFDNLNVQWRNVLSLPLKLTVGRQDILDLGNGWLIAEGTPLDGSRTYFFDAIRTTWEIKDAKTTVDLIYINQHAREDYYIKPFDHNDERFFVEQDEEGVIVWVKNKSLPNNTELSGYFIYKKDEQQTAAGVTGETYTFGLRGYTEWDKHWRSQADVTPQFGHRFGQAVCALGVNTKTEYLFRDRLNNQLRMAYEYLSGDDPATSKDESFDILWGRYQQFSEILATTIGMEGRPAAFTNLHRIGPGWTFTPAKDVDVCADYNILFADENSQRNDPRFSSNGRFRGQVLGLLLKHKINEHLSHYLLGEAFFPGDYYSDSNNDVATLVRYNIAFSW